MRQVRLHALVVGGLSLLATGCAARRATPLAPPASPPAGGAAGTWVLTDVDGHAVPTAIALDATFRVLLVDRRLVLAGDGTFRQAGEGRLEAGRRAIAALPEVAGRWTARDSSVAFVAVGGERVVAQRAGASLSYRDGGHAWAFQRCAVAIVGATCHECHRAVDASDPATSTTYRFAAACSDVDDEHP